jgi:hypothetical protein
MLQVDTIERMKGGHLVSHYLLSSYAYYLMSASPLSDAAFDRLCARLLREYDTIEHPHKHIIDKEHLQAGTGYYLRDEDYPRMVTSGMDAYLAKCASGQMAKDLEPYLLPTGTARPSPRVARTPRPSVAPAPVVVIPAPAPTRIRRTPRGTS